MTRNVSHKSVSLVAVTAIAVAVIALGFISYPYIFPDKTGSIVDDEHSVTADDIPEPPEVTTKEHLDDAIETLDSVDTTHRDDAEHLNWQLDAF